MPSLHPMDEALAEDREADGQEFICDECGTLFVIPFDEYEGQFDHPPSVPLCAACLEKRESHGTKCRCRDCQDDKGDWLYEQQKDREALR